MEVNIKNGLIFKTRLGYFVINYADDNRVVYSPIVERQKEMDRGTFDKAVKEGKIEL